MKATRELIDAMRVTADRIESGEYRFSWSDPSNCYCGCLARTVLKLSNPTEIGDKLIRSYEESIWSDRAKGQYCSTTGIELDVVFQSLYDIGLTSVKDFEELEFAGVVSYNQYKHTTLRIRNSDDWEFKNKEYAINYFRTKANELEKQLLNQQVVIKKQVEVQTVAIQ